MQKKLPVWRVIRATFDYLGKHGGQMLAMAPLLVVILFMSICLSMFVSDVGEARRNLMVELAGWMLGVAGPVLAAVAWHRRILLNETPRGIATGEPERMYFIVAAGSGALMFAWGMVGALIVALTRGPEGVPPFVGLLVLALWLVPFYFIGHLYLALPQAALTGKVDLRGITALTQGNKWRFLAVAVVPIVPILVALDLIREYLLQVPPVPSLGFYVYGGVVALISTLIVVTTMSISYRMLALPPVDGEPDSQAGEMVQAES